MWYELALRVHMSASESGQGSHEGDPFLRLEMESTQRSGVHTTRVDECETSESSDCFLEKNGRRGRRSHDDDETKHASFQF